MPSSSPALARSVWRRLPSPVKKVVRALPGARTVAYELENVGLFSNLARHELMLSDRIRIDTYQRGIARHVKPGDVVLDLGTGTGVLATMAIRQGARKVYALDHSPFIEVARAIAARNNVHGIEFVQQSSRDFIPPEPVDVVVHEQMGDELLNENMLVNISDLRRRVLKPTGRIIPALFDLYMEPVELLDYARIPRLETIQIDGFDLSTTTEIEALRQYREDVTYGTQLFQPGRPFVSAFLTNPVPALSFDLNEVTSESDVPAISPCTKTIVRSGNLDGFCCYFRCRFDAETGFDTSPLSPPTHWGNRFIRVDRRAVTAGQVIKCVVRLPDFTDGRSYRVDLEG